MNDHEQFMEEINSLRDQIFMRWITRSCIYDQMVSELGDINTYGTEPIFSGVVYDAMLEEAKWDL